MDLKVIYKISRIIILGIGLCITGVSNAQNIPDSSYREDLNAVEAKLRAGDFQAGLDLLDDITMKYPANPEVFYAKSLVLGQMGRFDESLKSAQAAYANSNTLFYANHLLGLYKSKKDLNSGIDLLIDLKGKFPNHEGLKRELLILYTQNNQLTEAEKLYTSLSKAKHSDTLDLVMSEIYLNTDNLSGAKKILSRMDGKTMLADVYGYLAYIAGKEGKNRDAIAVVERGIKRTQNKSLYLDLADIHKGTNKLDAMYSALKIAFDASEVPFIDKYKFLVGLMSEENTVSDDKLQWLANTLEIRHPDVLEAQVIKGEVLWRSGNTQEAKSIFLKVLSSNPRYVKVWRLLINTDLSLGQPDEAIKHGLEGLKHNPNNTEILYFTSLAYAGKEDYESSKNLLETALNYSVNENSYLRSLIYGSLGDIYHYLKMESMSDAAYDEALLLDSMNVSVLNNYAYYLGLRKKNLDMAAAYSKRSLAIEPNSATYADTYAWILFQQGKYTEALIWIEKAVKLSQGSAVLYEHYGDILSMLNREKEALVQWNKALELEMSNNSNNNLAKIQQKIKERKYVE